VKPAAILTIFLALAMSLATAQQANDNDSALKGKTREQLIACFSAQDVCGADTEWEIADSLSKPENKAFLLAQFHARSNREQKNGIIYALYHIDDPEVAAFFTKLIEDRYQDGGELYYPLNYLAKRCDQNALRILSRNGKGGYKGVPGCMQWATTVELFGKCQYKPAVPYLIDSLDATCMNIGGAADDSLRAIFPGSLRFDSPTKEQVYFWHLTTATTKPKN
jgi:hypothetical protein